MKILIVDTYYTAFLAKLYAKKSNLFLSDYQTQLDSLLSAGFGTSDFYSRHLNALGCEALDLIVNCEPLQRAWAEANHIPLSSLALKTSRRLFRIPLLGQWLSSLPNLLDVAIAQIKKEKPDVLYCQDLSFFPPNVLSEIRPYVRLIVGQIASPLPSNSFLTNYDLILTSFPHFVDRLRSLGLRSEYFRIGFDSRILGELVHVNKDISFSFVGGISQNHDKAIPLLEHLVQHTPIQIFGYGVKSLSTDSPIHNRHYGEVWGMDMYRALARSRITFNRHINVAENYANNMRLYEATGVGTLLLTDRKDNLDDLFKVGKEVLAYSSPEEAIELIQYYLANPVESETIAKAGQARTLKEHTYRHRMEELIPILRDNL